MENNSARLKLKVALIERCGTIASANLRLGRPKGDQRLYRLVAGYALPTDQERRELAWLTQKKIRDLFEDESEGEK